MEEEKAAMRAAIQAGDTAKVVEDLENHVEDLKKELTSRLKINVQRLNEIDKLKSEKAALEQQNQKVLADNESVRAEYRKLILSNNELTEDNRKLKSKNDALERENAKLKFENAALAKDNKRILSQLNLQKEIVQDMKKEKVTRDQLARKAIAQLEECKKIELKSKEFQSKLRTALKALKECVDIKSKTDRNTLKLENNLKDAKQRADQEKALREKVESELAATKRQAAAAAQRAEEEKLQADLQSFAEVSQIGRAHV